MGCLVLTQQLIKQNHSTLKFLRENLRSNHRRRIAPSDQSLIKVGAPRLGIARLARSEEAEGEGRAQDIGDGPTSCAFSPSRLRAASLSLSLPLSFSLSLSTGSCPQSCVRQTRTQWWPPGRVPPARTRWARQRLGRAGPRWRAQVPPAPLMSPRRSLSCRKSGQCPSGGGGGAARCRKHDSGTCAN